MYPKEIESKYVVTEEWPPTIEVIRAEISCAVEVSIIEDRVYCSKVESEGAAGSVYKSYYHSVALGSSGYLANVTFTLRFPQCLNYDESEQAQCKEDQADEKIDQLIDEIIQTLVIK